MIEPKYAYDVQARTLLDRDTGDVIAAGVSAELAPLFMFAPNLREHGASLREPVVSSKAWAQAFDELSDAIDRIDAYEERGRWSDLELAALERSPTTIEFLCEALSVGAREFDRKTVYLIVGTDLGGKEHVQTAYFATRGEAENVAQRLNGKSPGLRFTVRPSVAPDEVDTHGLVQWFAGWRERVRLALAGDPIAMIKADDSGVTITRAGAQ